MPLAPAGDASPADWVVESLTTFGHNVAALVPDPFEAYARVFHPAWLGDEGGHDVTWREIAQANRKTPHAGMQFRAIGPQSSLGDPDDRPPAQPGLWTSRPSDGDIPEQIATELARVLTEFTFSPDECYFAYWEGWGDAYPLVPIRQGPFEELRAKWAGRKTKPEIEQGSPRSMRERASHFKTPGRGYHLFSGDISDVVTQWQGLHGSLPTMWWPADKAWFVHTEIDLDTTFVGASRSCIDALLANEALEAWEVELSQGISWDSDDINRP